MSIQLAGCHLGLNMFLKCSHEQEYLLKKTQPHHRDRVQLYDVFEGIPTYNFITNVHLLDFNLKSDFCLSSIIFLPRSLREKKCGFAASRGDFAVNILEHGCSCKKIKLYNGGNCDCPGCWKTEVRNLDRPELHFHRGWLAKRNKKRWMEFIICYLLNIDPLTFWKL